MSNVSVSKFSDGSNVGYITSQSFFKCDTADNTAAKVATSLDSVVFSDTSLVRGVSVHVYFTNGNTSNSPTLQVGTSTAKPIVGTGWAAGCVFTFTYDGTSWIANQSGLPPALYEANYGTSTWAEIQAAINNNCIVYCKVPTSTSSGASYRMAFLAFRSPNDVEFQYLRSASNITSSQPCDEVYVYKLTQGGVWSTTARNVTGMIDAGDGITITYANGKPVISTNALPAVTSSDNGKVLMVVNGAWTASNLPIYNGEVSSS